MRPKIRILTLLCIVTLLSFALGFWRYRIDLDAWRCAQREEVFALLDALPEGPSIASAFCNESEGVLWFIDRDYRERDLLGVRFSDNSTIEMMSYDDPTALARVVNRLAQMDSYQARLTIEEYAAQKPTLRNYETLLPFITGMQKQNIDGSGYFQVSEGLLFRVAQRPLSGILPGNEGILNSHSFEEFELFEVIPTDDPYNATLKVIDELAKDRDDPERIYAERHNITHLYAARRRATRILIWYQLSQAIGHLINDGDLNSQMPFDVDEFKVKAKDLKVKWDRESQSYIKAS